MDTVTVGTIQIPTAHLVGRTLARIAAAERLLAAGCPEAVAELRAAQERCRFLGLLTAEKWCMEIASEYGEQLHE